MKVKDLIEALQKCDADSPVEVAIEQYGKRYPVAYRKIDNVISKQNGQDTRIRISLPENMRTSIHKPKG